MFYTVGRSFTAFGGSWALEVSIDYVCTSLTFLSHFHDSTWMRLEWHKCLRTSGSRERTHRKQGLSHKVRHVYMTVRLYRVPYCPSNTHGCLQLMGQKLRVGAYTWDTTVCVTGLTGLTRVNWSWMLLGRSLWEEDPGAKGKMSRNRNVSHIEPNGTHKSFRMLESAILLPRVYQSVFLHSNQEHVLYVHVVYLCLSQVHTYARADG